VTLAPFTAALIASPPFAPVIEHAAHRVADLRITAPVALHPVIASALAQRSGPLLVVTATSRQAEDFAAALHTWAPHLHVVHLPSWETLPHERLAPSLEAMGRRVAVLHRLRHGDADDPLRLPIDVMVGSIRAIAQPIDPAVIDEPGIRVRTGDEMDPTSLVTGLVEMGFERVDLVERRGQVAVRGGIVDVFCATAEHPTRIEFWGDTVEDIRDFAVSDQRSLGSSPDGLLATPVHEPGWQVSGRSLISLLGDAGAVLVSQPERVQSRSADLRATGEEFARAAWLTEEAPAEGGSFISDEQLRADAGNLPWWQVSEFAIDSSDALQMPARELDTYRGDLQRATTDLREWCAEQRMVAFVTAGQGSAERWSETLVQAQIPVQQTAAAGVVQVTTGHVDDGFVLPGFAVMTESDLLAQRSRTKDMSRMPTRRRRTIDPLTLKPGDFIVHEQHGVGKYIEMLKRTVAGAEREYIVVEYAASKRGQPPDRLYVPMDQLDAVTQYVGGEAPSVHRLGGSDWQQAKRRARKAIKDITDALVRLYATRQAARGHAFEADSPWQHELEDAFEYVETADQLACIDEVKADMERAVPMDRLICGDVGYGKTEIAVRAAFKAVQDGKQVAVLVPTTLLVQQHLATFGERYASFPVTVAGLSRFSTNTEVRDVLNGLASGAVDVVIGTHRLLTPDVKFKDLGLVVVDEEQRFGVEHKEHLKALRTNVDVLAMSATPIPRSLEMAVTGIREMSVIQTPPEERHPVLTFVGPYDNQQIAAAIRRELIRDGQVFFVHNRVSSINRVAATLQELVPEASIAVAHGQMNERALEQIILDFWEGKIDVLVCSTIVESGIDIPNANTLIVDRADTFGLSQLHQLRGRVGRGRERAYAYFLYAPDGTMTQTAHERLSTIAQHNELGAGMHIAMKDLEIRGAGNLLGGEQSGHIADVGFDLYVRMVGEALAEAKGEGNEVPEVKVELPLDAFIPSDYVPHERLRLEAYRRLAAAHDAAAVTEVRDELVDRYGPIPEQVEMLLAVALFRAECREQGVREVVLQGKVVRIAPVTLAESAELRINRLYPGTIIKAATHTLLVPVPRTSAAPGAPTLRDGALLTWARDLVQELGRQPAPTRSGAQ